MPIPKVTVGGYGKTNSLDRIISLSNELKGQPVGKGAKGEAVSRPATTPDFPVLPGVAQLGLAERYAERLAGRTMTLRAVRRLKFMRVITPGESVVLHVVRKGGTEFAWEITKGGETCSSGLLDF